VFESRVLRRIFRPKRDEVTAGWRKLHNEELHDVLFAAKYMSNWSDQVKEGEMGRASSTSVAKRNACIFLVGRPRGNRS
jgi:hypothetical protein